MQQLFHYSSAQADDFYHFFFTLPDDSGTDPFLAWKVCHGGHPGSINASKLGNTEVTDATVLAGLMSLSWQPATDVPAALLNHPDVPDNARNPRWQTTEVSSDFLDVLAGKPVNTRPVVRKGPDGILLIIALLVAVAIWYFGFGSH